MGFSQRLQQAWWRNDGQQDGLSTALLDLSWLYGALMRLRRKLYSSGVMDSSRLSVPIIVVGNVIAGGAGKTPIVIELARLLQQAGYRPGIISRGYGRRVKTLVEVQADTPVDLCGDEPALMHAALKMPLVVYQDRAEAARALLAAHPEVNIILSDDGLQHLALQRDLEIIVFDERGIGNGRLLPAGPLRESWPRQADFILYRGNAPGNSKVASASDKTNRYAIQRSLADYAVKADGSHIPLKSLSTQPLVALAGIANPEAFFSMLRTQGLTLTHTLALPDHYNFDSIPSNKLPSKQLICTEKDAIKLHRSPWAQEFDILAVPLQTALPPAFTQAFLSKLSSAHGPQTA